MEDLYCILQLSNYFLGKYLNPSSVSTQEEAEPLILHECGLLALKLLVTYTQSREREREINSKDGDIFIW